MKKLKKSAGRKVVLAVILLMVFTFAVPGNAAVYASSEPFLGEIIMFAGNFAPKGWAFCNGQLLEIRDNTALFSLLGTTYGGNGITNFALPDLRGRSPIGVGQGPMLGDYTLGQVRGTENTTMIITQMPAHNHALSASTAEGTTNTPGGGVVLGKAVTPDRQEVNIYTTATPNTNLSVNTISITGGSQPQENRDPYLAINYIIAVEGVYPSRP